MFFNHRRPFEGPAAFQPHLDFWPRRKGEEARRETDGDDDGEDRRDFGRDGEEDGGRGGEEDGAQDGKDDEGRGEPKQVTRKKSAKRTHPKGAKKSNGPKGPKGPKDPKGPKGPKDSKDPGDFWGPKFPKGPLPFWGSGENDFGKRPQFDRRPPTPPRGPAGFHPDKSQEDEDKALAVINIYLPD